MGSSGLAVVRHSGCQNGRDLGFGSCFAENVLAWRTNDVGRIPTEALMTGLNLETFLHLLRADLGAWVSLGAVGVILALLTWTSWGSRRALRKCLVVSLVVHVSVVLYGSTLPIVRLAANARSAEPEDPKGAIRQIRVAPLLEPNGPAGKSTADGRSGRREAVWDRPREELALADPSLRPNRPVAQKPELERPGEAPPALEDSSATPEVNPPAPPGPETRPEPVAANDPPPSPPQAAPADAKELARLAAPEPGEPEPESGPATIADRRLRPERRESVAAQAAILPQPPRREGGTIDLANAPAPETPAPAKVPEARPGPPPAQPSALAPVAAAVPDQNPVPGSRSKPKPKAPSGPAVATIGPDDIDVRARIRRPGQGAGGSSPVAPPANRLATTGVATLPAEPAGSDLALPEADLRQRARSGRTAGARGTDGARSPARPRVADTLGPIALANASPAGPSATPGLTRPVGGRSLSDIPAVYRSRLDPNRSNLAQRAGASSASEQAVEGSLEWLARHQDADGRWNGGSSRTAIPGLIEECKDSFTTHCPPDDVCKGECGYAEADTALTGLTLLAYLGAGYTHTDGKYAENVGKGLRFLLLQQKPDGDLRGPSRAVGMYCHAMATLALCEAFALTGDSRLRDPAERAVNFLVQGQAKDGLSWRYTPRDAVGDTSILGWVVLVLRSARVVGIAVPPQAQGGALGWLGKVSAGESGGLGRYQPSKPVTSTMTAEAWVCRQLLGVGGPGPASTEAAEFLLMHGPDRDPYNLYYWYYGTLAMYQNGGTTWNRWNQQVRDQLVRRQRREGHATGSWDPDEDPQYGARGGRIYSTALATLTLEVYYRYLRFYDEPGPSPRLAPAQDPASDSSLRRARR
jgi:hypothetical protein